MNYGGKTVDELKKLLKASTPGDWRIDTACWHGEPAYTKVQADCPYDPKKVVDICDTLNADSFFSPEDNNANMECLVAAREALLPLLDRVGELEGLLELRPMLTVKMVAGDIGCREVECQHGRGDPPMDCIWPDCLCGIYLVRP